MYVRIVTIQPLAAPKGSSWAEITARQQKNLALLLDRSARLPLTSPSPSAKLPLARRAWRLCAVRDL
jgi:hypothetical protein